jgi:hypothetical protein
MLQSQSVLTLEAQRFVVALEQRDEQGEAQERVGAQFEEGRIIVLGQGPAFRFGECQPRAGFAVDAVQDAIGIISKKSMKPWVALPGACRLSRLIRERQPSKSP